MCMKTDITNLLTESDITIFAETHLSEPQLLPEFPGYSALHKIRASFSREGISAFSKVRITLDEIESGSEDILV